jgi:hypothetical protein
MGGVDAQLGSNHGITMLRLLFRIAVTPLVCCMQPDSISCSAHAGATLTPEQQALVDERSLAAMSCSAFQLMSDGHYCRPCSAAHEEPDS